MSRLVVLLWVLVVAVATAGLVFYDSSWTLVPDESETLWFDDTLGALMVDVSQQAADSGDPTSFLADRADRYPFPVAWAPRSEMQPDVIDAWNQGYRLGFHALEDGEYYYSECGVDGAVVWGPIPPYSTVGMGPRHLTTLGFVAFGVAGVLGVLLWPVGRAHHELEAAAERIGGGDLDARVTSGTWVAPRLAGAFNAMADDNQRRLQAHKELLRSVSHELRTPIARLRLAAHLLLDDHGDRASHEASLRQDLDELDGLLDELLDLARVDGQTVVRAPVRLDEVARRAVDREGIRAAVQTTEVTVDGDAQQIERAVRNLVRNAAQHGGSAVSVRVEGDGRVIVDDDGPGIPEADRHRVLEPFAQVGEDRTGTGLGLAIVERIAGLHGAQFELKQAPMGGLRAVLAWPTR